MWQPRQTLVGFSHQREWEQPQSDQLLRYVLKEERSTYVHEISNMLMGILMSQTIEQRFSIAKFETLVPVM